MKKITKILLAAVMAVGMVLPTAGCGECKHNVGTWEIVTAPTCETKGEKQGICGVCYEMVSEVIPADSEAHVYNPWEILSAPTETETGSAKRICSVNGAHTLTIDLPVLGDTEYNSEITTRPTPAKDGVRTYTLKHETGAVSFTQPVPAMGVQTVRDAVDLGIADESKDTIRRAEGTMGLKFYNEGATKPRIYPTSNHSYEFGDGYTHIVDGSDNCERWYFTDETGEIFGLTNYKDGINPSDKVIDDMAIGNGNVKYIDGSRLYIQYVNELGYFYGVESLLEGMYRSARWSDNDDFREWVDTDENGKATYGFFFGNVQNSGSDSGYFSQLTTTFTLSDAYAIESITVEAITYANNRQQTDGNDIISWEFNEEGNAVIIPGKETTGARYVTTVSFTQTEKAEGDVVPTNPHTMDKMYVTDFDITYNGEVMQEGDIAYFASGVSTNYIFSIINVEPAEALRDYGFDNFGFYLRVKEGGKVVDIPIDYGSMASVGMAASMNSSKQFLLNAKHAGTQTVVVKTAHLEKEIHCQISEATPTALYPAVYEYVGGDYMWDRRVETEATTVSKTVYINQPLYFTADVPVDQKNYAAANYTLLESNGQAVDMNTTKNYLETAVDGTAVTQFTSETAGRFTITMASKLNMSIRCTISVTVVAPPEFTTLAAKAYTQEIKYPQRTTVDVTFEEVATTDGGKTYTATANIVTGQGEEKLSCTFDKETGMLTTEHLSGAEFGYVLGLNSAYDFVLTHYVEEFHEEESVVLFVNTKA